MTAPRISVLIPNYNHSYCLRRALDGVCLQDPAPHEVLILDDRSTDNSLDILKEYADKYPFVRYLQYPEKSQDWVVACGDHIDSLTGDYVLWLAADDYVYPGLFQTVSEVAQNYPGVGAIYSCSHWVDQEGQVRHTHSYGLNEVRFMQGPELHDFYCKPGITINGLASVLRGDMFQWLKTERIADLGVWSEIVYTMAAMKHGAAFLPQIYGAYTTFGKAPNPTYHEEMLFHAERSIKYYNRLSNFLRQPKFQDFMAPKVITAMEQYAISTFPPQVKQQLAVENAIRQAQALLQLAKHTEAAQLLVQITNQIPNFADAWALLGVAMFQLGRHRDAETALSRATALNPQVADWHSNLAACFQAQGKLDEAAASQIRSIQLRPESAAREYNQLGNTLVKLGRNRMALDVYARAVEADKNHSAARQQLERLQLLLNAAESVET